MLTIWIHLDTGGVRKANVPEDYSTGDLLADVLNSSHPGSPRIEWGLYDEVPEKILSLHKSLAQNQVKNEAHLHLYSRAQLALELDAPGHSAEKRDVPANTLTGTLLTDLVRHFQLDGLPTDWQLVPSGSPNGLDLAKTLSANGVRTGAWLSVQRKQGPLPPPVHEKFIKLTLREPQTGRAETRTLPASTVLSGLLRDAVDTFGLPRVTRSGRAQDWIFIHEGSREALNLDGSLEANRLRDGSVLQLVASGIEPLLVLKMIAPGGAVKDVEAESELGTEHLLRMGLRAFALPEAHNGRLKRYRLQDKTRNNKELNLTQTLGQNGVVDQASLQILPVVFPWHIVAIATLGALLLGALMWFVLKPRIKVELTASNSTIAAAETAKLNARIINAKDQTILWSLSPEIGEITSDGTYTAPDALPGKQVVHITAISREDTSKSASVDLTLVPAPPPVQPDTTPQTGVTLPSDTTSQPAVQPQPDIIPIPGTTTPSSLKVLPATANISAGQARRFAVTPDPGSPVQWQISPSLGKIGPDGVYTAPSTVAQDRTVTVTALLFSGGSTGTAIIHLRSPAQPPPPKPENTIDAIQAVKGENGQTVLRALNRNGNAVAAIWSLSPEVGSISTAGVYTPPAKVDAPRDVTVRAASQANPASVSSYTLHLAASFPTGITVLVSPQDHAALRPGDRKTFEASVRGTGNTVVTWTAMGGGNIFPNGLYVAPASVPRNGETVRIRATSNANPSIYGEAEITLHPLVAPVAPRQGTFLWQGKLNKRQTLTIRNNLPSTGSLSGTLPEGPVEVHVSAGDCDIVMAPSASNNWSVLAVKAKSNQTSITFGWTSLSALK